MRDDLQAIQDVRSQTLTVLAEITASPKPTYQIEGQTVSWSDYLSRLQQTIDWCDRKLGEAEPFEIRSQGTTS